jgi:DNA-binding beta-propeller fold protein YncE
MKCCFIVAQLSIPNISINAKWMQNGITVAGGNGNGNALNQLSRPWSVYIDNDQTLYVADQSNDRIVKWKKGATNGEVVAGGNGRGSRNDQLSRPMIVIVDKQNDFLIICDRGNNRVVRWPCQKGTSGEIIISNVDCWSLMIDDDGSLYVSDHNKHEVRRYEMRNTTGTVVAGGNGAGDRLDQLNGPYFIFVDREHSVYVSDWGNHRVIKWVKGAKEGIVVSGGHSKGNGLTQLSGPLGVVVDHLGTIYVVDHDNNRVMRWLKGARQGDIVIGGYETGGSANQFNYPCGLSFDRHNNLYVVDNNNHRIQRFNIEPDSTM